MKKAYWFVFAFLIWCAACSLWYLFGVKGVLSSDQSHFDAANRLVAIAEILFMLLGACLLGFVIAWMLKEEEVFDLELTGRQIQSENEALIKSREDLSDQLQAARTKQSGEISSFKLKVAQLNHEKEESLKKIEETESNLQKLKIENGERKWMLEQKTTESDAFKSQIKELETVRKSLEQSNLLLKDELKQMHTINVEKHQVSQHPFVRPVVQDQKDDLTKIKGIGIFAEKRLNMLGIYTFEQLSELEPEMIERVGAAIEFFPGRILRENWIGQARNFSSKS